MLYSALSHLSLVLTALACACFSNGESHYINEAMFHRQVETALETTRKLLRTAREPVHFRSAESVPHAYEDKYLLAEFLTKSATRSTVSLLRHLNATNDDIMNIIEWAKEDSIMLRFTAERRCSLDHWSVRDVESPTSSVKTEVNGNSKKTTTHRSITTVNESFWKIGLEYTLAVVGRMQGHTVTLLGQSELRTNDIIVTPTSSRPYPAVETSAPRELDLTWLFSNTQVMKDDHGEIEEIVTFEIDRMSIDTKTPRRNKDVDEAMIFFKSLSTWGNSVLNFFMNIRLTSEYKIQEDELLNTNDMFIPILPVFQDGGEKCERNEINITCELTPSPRVFNLFLEEEARVIRLKLAEVDNKFTTRSGLITSPEAKLIVLLAHSYQIGQYFVSGLEYIEALLGQQLAAAVGKELSSHHLGEYMDYHNNLLLREEFSPKAFSYAVRRSVYSSPEGQVSIEFKLPKATGSSNKQIKTMVRRLENQIMEFPISASTNVKFGGDRFLHAWLYHSFSEGLHGNSEGFSIVANARQFSSFILVLGRVTSSSTIEPTYAIIVKDKDFLSIPLDLEVIPSAKEFRDATASLSPEQQEFAKAFRSMQLSSTLFTLCIIQIKPQLEKVLNLVPDSLTKEIKLTQDLMDLFVEYQIPSDLLSYSDDARNASSSERISAVQASVTAMKDMIAASKEELIKEAERVHQFNDPLKDQRAGKSMNLITKTVPTSFQSFGQLSSAPLEPLETEKYLRKSKTASDGAHNVAADNLDQNGEGIAGAASPTQKASFVSDSSSADLISIPNILDTNFDKYCNGSVLRSAMLNLNFPWSRTRQKSLLTPQTKSFLSSDDSSKEKFKAFELIDALTKSGGLTIDHASFHAIVSTQHAFDKTLMNTIIQDNINPISKLEVSSLTVAATLHSLPLQRLLRTESIPRFQAAYPLLAAVNH